MGSSRYPTSPQAAKELMKQRRQKCKSPIRSSHRSIVWQRGEADAPARAMLRSKIAEIIVGHKPVHMSQDEWLEVKLPKMARHIERILYRRAASLGEYRNEETLRLRLRLYGEKVSKERRSQQKLFNLNELKQNLPDVSASNVVVSGAGICA